jgi:hypothetical protein
MTKPPSTRTNRRTSVTRASKENGPADSGRAERIDAAIRLLDEWMADESGYDEETWPKLQAALEEDRLSSRRLFDA